MAFRSFRSRLRAFQVMRGNPPDPGFVADLEFLENRDLDLSVRLGAMLGFNALLITIGTHPISASPGAPLSVDAATQPVLTLLSLAGIVPLILSCGFALRAMLLGEEFDSEGMDDDQVARRRLYSAFVHSIDVQARLLGLAIRSTVLGGVLTLGVWAAILSIKMA
ncbi:hypothetical protein B0I00_1342 [Novosphingobium kunmingense]|uniref:Uncharacterized protein n=1 Tax=Novosphingobium kunmingense TaxID=1211806 RepID=A0A2N0HJJ2_9SPHN|nr:hypothetical protein [Novosphingobium kunmingense]PKB19114.1 hypothetical protein B0I00_1342 [Novosphingobium kunmingense]